MTTQTLTIEQVLAENRALKNQLKILQEQFDWLKNQMFGKRSEKLLDQSQQLLLPGLEEAAKPSDPPKQKIVPAHTRCIPNRKGQDQITLPEGIPIETIVIDIPEKDKICKITGLPLVKIGEECSQKLAYKLGKVYVKKIIRPKYAYPKQEEKRDCHSAYDRRHHS